MEKLLRETLASKGYEVFDLKVEEQPEGLTPDVAGFWGGYAIEFKLIDKAQFQQFRTFRGSSSKRLTMSAFAI